eukprot:GHVS01007175.1.p1 GENE.GHVS01007175.1~~GHVS01007175.1.p1  ORF type:complete len:184 (+),score=28.54 GHVS01007175.1:2-553(+)
MAEGGPPVKEAANAFESNEQPVDDLATCEISMDVSDQDMFKWLATFSARFTLFFEARCFGGIIQRFIYDAERCGTSKGIVNLHDLVGKKKHEDGRRLSAEQRLKDVSVLKDSDGHFNLKVIIRKHMCSGDKMGVKVSLGKVTTGMPPSYTWDRRNSELKDMRHLDLKDDFTNEAGLISLPPAA